MDFEALSAGISVLAAPSLCLRVRLPSCEDNVKVLRTSSKATANPHFSINLPNIPLLYEDIN